MPPKRTDCRLKADIRNHQSAILVDVALHLILFECQRGMVPGILEVFGIAGHGCRKIMIESFRVNF